MKKTLHLLTTALLLTTSHIWADSYKGTLERHGLKMEYTLSGGIVTDKDDHRIVLSPEYLLSFERRPFHAEPPDHYVPVSCLLGLSASQSSALLPLHSSAGYQSA